MSFTFKETEDKIKKYYESLKVIGRLRHRLEIYRKRKIDIENKIDKSLVRLEDNFTAVNYGSAGGGLGGIKTSPQEKAVDKAFLILERNLEDVNAEILLIEEEINSIEAENSDMEYILKDMKQEYKEVAEALYKYEKGTLKTAMDCNMDRVTVYRKKDKVVKEVMKWLNYYA